MRTADMYQFDAEVQVLTGRTPQTIPRGVHALLDTGADLVSVLVGHNQVQFARSEWLQLVLNGSAKKK
jgi:hypothetical protein